MHRTIEKKSQLSHSLGFAFPLPNFNFIVRIFFIANNREAIYIMTTVKSAT
jgi:hypothetical protein